MPDENLPIKEYGEIVALAAAAVGLPVSEFRAAVAAVRKRWDRVRTMQIRDEEKVVRSRGFHRRLIRDYYFSRENTDLQQYTILLSNTQLPSTIFTKSNRVGLSLPLASLKTQYVPLAPEPLYSNSFVHLSKSQAAKVANKLDLLGVQIWDQDLYRLAVDPFVGDKLNLSFSLSRFMRYRFTAGLLEDEVLDSLISNNNDIDAILQKHAKGLPLRSELLPSVDSLSNVTNRISAGGLACVVAMARGTPDNDYCIPLQLRSDRVAEGRGVYTATIQAWHQPMLGNHQGEVKLYWTVLRELFEEAFGGEEVQGESRRLRHDWYLEKCPGVAYIHRNPDAVTLELLGFGVNALLGTYDCAILLAIHDPTYWDTYSSVMMSSWEAKGITSLSTRDPSPLLKDVFASGWFDQGMFSLSQGLLRLQQLNPQRAPIPSLGFELH